MKKISKILMLFFVIALCFIPVKSVFAGAGAPGNTIITTPETDNPFSVLSSIFYIFDLRDRETYIQLTSPDYFNFGIGAQAHVQIFDVSNNCNENNFFDAYTVNDTHVYNMRDIQTNDGNPSGVVLPDGAYGIVVISLLSTNGQELTLGSPIGNVRILDNNGYEYRTNGQLFGASTTSPPNIPASFYSFNFNQENGIALSDIFGATLFVTGEGFEFEWKAQPVQGIFSPFDIDIYNLNEVPFSCRDIIFSCVDENNPLLEEVLSIAGTANIARFEYGINDAIPNTKGGELLCPGNVISDGEVILRPEQYPDTPAFTEILDSINGTGPFFFGFVGLNNGNGRGSMDSLWTYNCIEDNCLGE